LYFSSQLTQHSISYLHQLPYKDNKTVLNLTCKPPINLYRYIYLLGWTCASSSSL
jgi:hypothetical protein